MCACLCCKNMGIPSISKLIDRHAPDAVINVPFTAFAGKRIAIDAFHWLHANMSIARKKVVSSIDVTQGEPNPSNVRRELLSNALNFILNWLSYGITPVFVFDGKQLPDKADTREKRQNKRAASRAKIDALYTQVHQGNGAGIYDELKRELINYDCIASDDFEIFRSTIKGIGIPCIQAVSDGEQLCSMLCFEGKVAAVFSGDYDNLVYGCPLMIKRVSDTYSYDARGVRVPAFACVRIDKVLAGLKLSHSEFVDLCIMCGCDFNTNMPGYAAIKSYDLIQRYRSIENLPRDLNTTCLNHVRCREIFTTLPSDLASIADDASDDPECSPLNIKKQALENARDYLDAVGLGSRMENLTACYHHVPEPTHGLILDIQALDAYKPPTQRKMMLNIVKSSS